MMDKLKGERVKLENRRKTLKNHAERVELVMRKKKKISIKDKKGKRTIERYKL
jgi:hypothetical protein